MIRKKAKLGVGILSTALLIGTISTSAFAAS